MTLRATFTILPRIFFIIFCAALVFPPSVFNAPALGLDHSWAMALHLAIKQNLVFGTDFIFTYGPLGFIITRLPIGVNKFVLVLFDLYLIANVLWVIYQHIKKKPGVFTYVVIVLLLFLLGNPFNYDLVFLMCWLLLFNLLQFIYFQNRPALYNALILSSIILFVKLNVGLVVIFIFSAFTIYSFFTEKLAKRDLLLFLGLQIVILLVGSFILNVNLPSYAFSSLYLLSGYNDAMYFPLGNDNYGLTFSYSVITIIFAIGSVLLFPIRMILKDYDFLLKASAISFFLFILFKQAFVRADSIHLQTFYVYAPIYFSLFIYFDNHQRKNLAPVLCLITAISFLTLNQGYVFWPDTWKIRIEKPISYLKSVAQETNRDFSELEKRRTIPAEILSQVQNSSVDIVPYEITYIGLNDLKYNPRPVIQSYSAYNSYLQKKNYEKYIATDAPDYLFFSNSSIDARYGFWDDSRVKIAMLENYELVFPNQPTFDENHYLTVYPDVREVVANGSISSGAEHFRLYGRKEGRKGSFGNFVFDENFYRETYPDVNQAIQQGLIPDGLTHYKQHGFKELRGTSDIAMLFKKRAVKRSIETKSTSQITAKVSQRIEIPQTDNLLFMKVDMKYSFLGKLKRLLFQPDRLFVRLYFEDGSDRVYVAILPIIHDEILINRRIECNQDAFIFYKTDGMENQKIIGAEFFGDSPREWNPDIDITFIEKVIK